MARDSSAASVWCAESVPDYCTKTRPRARKTPPRANSGREAACGRVSPPVESAVNSRGRTARPSHLSHSPRTHMGFAQTVDSSGKPVHRPGKGSHHQIGLVRGQFGGVPEAKWIKFIADAG